MALVLHLGGVGKCGRLIWDWSVQAQESGDLQGKPHKHFNPAKKPWKKGGGDSGQMVYLTEKLEKLKKKLKKSKSKRSSKKRVHDSSSDSSDSK